MPEEHQCRGRSWARPLYTLLVATTVLFELTVVLVSTATTTELMTGSVDPYHVSVTEFLMRELELNFLATRFHFFFGLLSFVVALAVRGWIVFPGDTQGHTHSAPPTPRTFVPLGALLSLCAVCGTGDTGKALALMFLAGGLQFVSFYDSTVTQYPLGLLGLSFRYAVLLGSSYMNVLLSATACCCLLLPVTVCCRVWHRRSSYTPSSPPALSASSRCSVTPVQSCISGRRCAAIWARRKAGPARPRRRHDRTPHEDKT